MEQESHDHNFKNLFMDFPKEALEFFLPEVLTQLGPIKHIEFDRQEPKKHHLKDPHVSLDFPIIFHFEPVSIVLWLVEFQEDKSKFSIYKLLKYTADKMEAYKDYTVVPTVLFTDKKKWRKNVQTAIESKLLNRLFIHFEYVFIRLFEYNARDHFYVQNPLVKILLPKMKYTAKERWEVIRQAYIGLFQLVSMDLFSKYSYFIDVYSEIDEDEKKCIEDEISEKKETVMIAQYFTEKGQKIGQKNGEMSILSYQFARRFNVDKETVMPRLDKLESNDLMELSGLILDYDNPEPIYKWIDARIEDRAVKRDSHSSKSINCY